MRSNRTTEPNRTRHLFPRAVVRSAVPSSDSDMVRGPQSSATDGVVYYESRRLRFADRGAYVPTASRDATTVENGISFARHDRTAPGGGGGYVTLLATFLERDANIRFGQRGKGKSRRKKLYGERTTRDVAWRSPHPRPVRPRPFLTVTHIRDNRSCDPRGDQPQRPTCTDERHTQHASP